TTPHHLPTYPFQHTRYWLSPARPTPAAEPAADGLWEALEQQDLTELSADLSVSETALGEVLPALSGWRAERMADRRTDSWRHRVAWQPVTSAPGPAPAGRWLALLPEDRAGHALVEALTAIGTEVLPVAVTGPGDDRESLAALLAEAAAGQPVAGVLSLLARERRPHPRFADLPSAVSLTLALVQALGDTGIDAPLWCLTSGDAVLGAGERPGGVIQGAVAGLARTVALEHPERWGGLVDVPAVLDERAVRRLCWVLNGTDREDQFAVRSTGVHVRRLLRAPARRPSGAVQWQPTGTVLLTGGTGAVGAQVARWLVSRGAERLVLLSRSGPSAPGAAELSAELGSAVSVVGCDLADPEALAAVVAAHRPTAVLHAAGVLDDGMLESLTPARMADSLRAKLTGARHLHELTADLELSAFVMFSSLMGVVGNAGQGSYAAANAALDALVAERCAAGLPGTSIAWGAWGGGGGMLADEVAERLRDRGLPAMPPQLAARAIGRALDEDDALVVVAEADWSRFGTTGGLRRPGLLEQLTRENAPATRSAAPPAPAPVTDRKDLPGLVELVRDHAAAVLRRTGTADLAPTRAFAELGFDSLTAVELRGRLAAATGLRLPATLLFDHPTPLALAERLHSELGGAAGPVAREQRSASTEPIAITGIGCRFPGGVRGPADLWELLAEGRDAVGDWPTDRGWDTERLYDPDPDRTGTTYSRQGAFLDQVGGFDAEFFGISPREALAMDPQQRLLLETSWQAVEHAGQDPASLRGRPVGVFVGTNGQDYLTALQGTSNASEGHFLTGNTASVLSGRISYALGLEGPALTVDTACSSSLVALHLAVGALRSGECEQALAGGVTVMSTLKLFVEFSRQRGLAPDGRCKAFSAAADGTGWGEGVGVLLLERLSDARRNGHPVLAVLRGSAVNQDGASNGLTAPNGPSQQRVIKAALTDAALTPTDIDAVEAHGTGTRLGDPIEAQALQAVYGHQRANGEPLWLGSLKSNIGHTQAAAGVAGVIKMVMALQHGLLPKTLHVDAPNPHIDWSDGAVELLTEAREWPQTGRPRRAGVSSFGISGTNAHVLLEQAPAEEARPAGDRPARVPLLLSARSRQALRAQAGLLEARLAAEPDLDAADLGHSLLVGRAALEHRAVLVGGDPDGQRGALAALAAGRSAAGLVTGTVRPVGLTAFLFPGQGSQRAAAGAGLYRSEPVFAAALDEVLSELAPHLDLSLRDLMFDEPGGPQAGMLDRTGYTQPALFALQTALFRLLEHWGVRPGLLLGHSVGELSAAHAAGVLGLRDACALVAGRGRLMDALPGGGAMVAVQAEESEVLAALDGSAVSLAAVNGPRSCVLSGDEPEVLRIADGFRAAGRRVHRLTVSHAFHSHRVDGVLADFRRLAESLDYSPPQLTVISNVTGEPAGAEQLCSPEYWVRQLRSTVRFLDGARRLADQGATAYLELGKDGVLSALVQECLPEQGAPALPLLREGRPEPDTVLEALAGLHVRGTAVDWAAGLRDVPVRRVELPGYPFQHQRYWPDRPTPGSATDRLRYRIDWQPLRLDGSARPSGRWLLVAPVDSTRAEACARALTGCGVEVELLPVPDGIGRSRLAGLLPPADGVLSLPDRPEHVLTLLQALGDAGSDAPLWCATRGAVSAGHPSPAEPEQAAAWGLGRVAALEYPARWGGLVDLPETLDTAATDALCAVLSGTTGEDQVAIRPSGALARRLRRAPAAAASGPGRPPRGTVLITGGTGGLGAQLARRLAGTGAGHLVLLSRGGTETPGAAELAADLTALGARVTVAACDVTDRAALRELLASLEGETVRAVVHAAGLTSDTPLADCAPDELAAEGAAKVTGAALLDELFRDSDLDAFVLFSSVSAAWGSGGQGGYAAANAYLDAVAEQRRARGLRALSVAWGPWAGAGMANGEVADRLRAHGLLTLAPATALDALQQALDLDETHTVVADVDWERFAPAFGSARPSPLLADLPGAHALPGVPSPTGPDGADGELRQRLDRLSGPERRTLLLEVVRDEAAAVLGRDPGEGIDADRPFREVGFDSLTAVELRNRLVRATGLPLGVTVVFDHPSAAALSAHLHAELSTEVPDRDRPTATGTSTAEPLAVVSMACRFPGGVRSPEQLWQLVGDGVDAIGPLPQDRGWPLADLYDADPDRPGSFYAQGGGFLDGAGEFDAEFFGISPREALAMDPQQRLLLETAWEAVERAGIDPRSLRGSRGAVYVGLAGQGYGSGPHDPAAGVEGHLLSGTVTSVASGRVAYTLGLEGPAVTVETACSSSLVALHLAGQSLRSGESDFALVGGAAVMASPDVFVEFSRQRGLSTDGRCRSFAEAADGTGWGEGAGMLLVERLSDARRLGHPVLALVKGTAVNQDGASNGLTAPNGQAQQRVIRQALANAGLTPDQVDLVEAHGTGTTLGDPIEAGALLAAYGQDRPKDRPLWLGSLKSNIGHTQAAAGVAGVIKTVLALRHGVLPRTLHAEQPSGRVDWSSGAIRLLTEVREWVSDGPRRAGVSSFGMSGTNAHAVLEQAMEPAPVPEPEPEPLPWLLSAGSAAALGRQAAALLTALEAGPEVSDARIGHALATSRAVLPHRAGLTGSGRSELLAGLTALAQGKPSAGVLQGEASGGRTVFVFPGQGTQWAGMAVPLLDAEPVFAAAMADCERALAPHTDWSLTGVLRSGEPLERADVVQPALFAVMVSLAALWRSWGVHPDAVIGHSQGEIAAAVVAGALTLQDGATVVAQRSHALRRLTGHGGMLSLSAPEQQVRELLLHYGDRLCVAAVNGPGAVVVAGGPEPLTDLLAACEQAGLRGRPIPVDYAAHSAQVEEIRTELTTALAGIAPRPSAVPLYSTVTGTVTDGQQLDAGYWYRNLREPVEFGRATLALLETGHRLFVEVGPHPVLLAGIDSTAQAADRPAVAVGTLRRGAGGRDQLLRSLTEAWTAGAAVDWGADRSLRPVPLPTYPFERQRYWLPTPGRGVHASPRAPLPVTGPVPVAEPEQTSERPAGSGGLALRLAGLEEAEQRRELLELVSGHAAAVLGHSGPTAVRPDRPFAEIGFDSMLAVRFRNQLCAATGVAVPPTAVFDHPTPAALAGLLHRELFGAAARPAGAELDRLERALSVLDPADPEGAAIGERLQSLLRTWTARDGRTEARPLDSATADELFDLLDNDFGMA
ncbi:SDR family NAD(P)-dependent oxidoreductase, partial [Streptacidiphilus sp. EB129]|uniref:SDR family NAD(P)-dependent oxidoreductase n=1 Tax=Streptacidiphilus sp. EB129 TaxID=3156262 RepID=UPI0035133BA9